MNRPSPAGRYGAPLGIGLMLVGIFLFSINDTLGKWLVATYSVGQLLLIRSLAGLACLAPFLVGAGPIIRTAPRPGLQLLRIASASLEVAAFYAAVAYLPLADVMAYYLAGPIYVVALSAPILGERVGWRRWVAVLVGFGGVLLILRPSAATLTLPAFIALAGSLLFAGQMLVTRVLRGTDDRVLVLGHTLGNLAMGAVLAPFGWVTPGVVDVALLSLLGAVALTAHLCVNRSLKIAPASVVVPFQYSLLVWAVLFGWLFFDEIPRATTLAGGAVIVVAGLALLALERRERS